MTALRNATILFAAGTLALALVLAACVSCGVECQKARYHYQQAAERFDR